MILLDSLLQWSFASHPCYYSATSNGNEYCPGGENSGNIFHFHAKEQLPTEPILFLFAMTTLKAVLQDYFPSFVENTTLRRRRRNSNSPAPSSLSRTSRLLQSLVTQETYLSILDSMSTLFRSFLGGAVLTQDTYSSLVTSSSSDNDNHNEYEEGFEEARAFAVSSRRRMFTEFLQGVGSSLGSALTVNGNIHSLLITSYLAYDHISWFEYAMNMALPSLSILSVVVTVVVLGLVLAGRQGSTNLPGFFASPSTSNNNADYYEGLSMAMVDEDAESPCTTNTNKEQASPTPRTVVLDGGNHGMVSSSNNAVQSFEMEPTTATPLGHTENYGHSILHSKSSFWVVVGAISVLILGYAMDIEIPAVALTVTLVLFWIGQSFFAASTNSNEASTSSTVSAEGQQGLVLTGKKLDLEPMLSYCGIAIMTLVLGDTGIPQDFYVRALGMSCASEPWKGMCPYQSGFVMYIQATVISPLATVFMLAGAVPYSFPLDWIRACFCLSMAAVARTLIGYVWSRRKMHTSKVTKWVGVVVSLLVPIPFVALGVYIISAVSFSKECSERLGICGEMVR